jgi:hypothetical protein
MTRSNSLSWRFVKIVGFLRWFDGRGDESGGLVVMMLDDGNVDFDLFVWE